MFAAGFDLGALHANIIQPNNDPVTLASADYIDNDRNTSNQELEASSSGPHSPIDIPEETTIQNSYPKYHMDNFIEPNERVLHLGETEETYRNESLHHCEVESRNKQFDESEDWPQYPDKDEHTVLLINHEPTDKSLQDICENNSASKLHELSVDGNDSLEACAENPVCRNIYVRTDSTHTNKSAPFSPNEECEMRVEDLEAGEKEEGPRPVDFLWERTGSPHERMFEPEFVTKPPTVTSLGKDTLLQTDVALESPDTSLHYEVGDHQVPKHESEMEPCYMCDANKVDGACEEALPVGDGFAHANVAATSVEFNEPLEEDLETKYPEMFEEIKVNNEVLVEIPKSNEVNANGSAPIPFTVKNEVLVEAYQNNEKDGTEGAIAVPTSPVVTTEAFVEIPKLNEEGNDEGCVLTPFALKNEVLVDEIDIAEGDVPASLVVNSEVLVETKELNEGGNAEGGVPKPFALIDEVLVEGSKNNEKDNAEGGVSASSAVNNEVIFETSELEKEGDVEVGAPISLEVKCEVLVEALKINEKDSAEGSVPPYSGANNVVPVENFELNEEDNCKDGVPIPSVDHSHEPLQNMERKTENEVSVESINEKEEASADTGAPTSSGDHVHEILQEILQEPTNLSCHEQDTPPGSKYEECHHESVGYAGLVLTTEGRNISQSCTISLDNLLYDAIPSENLSEECSELHSNKPVPFTNLHNDQEKLPEDFNQIATEILHTDNTSKPWTVDPYVIAESCSPSSSIGQDQKVAREGFDLKPGNILGGNKSIDEVRANNALANVSVETKENELDMCSAYSLASEHKPPPLPPLGWRMGGKLLKGTSLPSNGHSSKPVDETNQNLLVQMSMAPRIANHDDSGRVGGEKPRVMSLSALPPLSCQHELANHNLTSVPVSGANVQNVEYNNGSSAVLGLTGPEMMPQYVWPDAQCRFLPVSAWNTGPSLAPVHQPAYLISLEDNLWAQYGIGPPIEDERLGRKHHSIRNIPRNPLMDAVAAHDRSTVIFIVKIFMTKTGLYFYNTACLTRLNQYCTGKLLIISSIYLSSTNISSM